MELNSNDTIHVVLHEANKANHSCPIWIYIIIAVIIVILILLNLKKLKRVLRNFRPSEYEVKIPGFGLKGNLQYTSIDQEVAWKIYVELITRVSANRLAPETGILRESLVSLYKVFGVMRDILRDSGAQLARKPKKGIDYTVATLLLKILNEKLRPFMAKWHPELEAHEKKKEENVSQFVHEKKWELNLKFREELDKLQDGLEQYVNALKSIAEGEGI